MFRSKSTGSRLNRPRLSMADRRNYPPLVRRVRIAKDLIDDFEQMGLNTSENIGNYSNESIGNYSLESTPTDEQLCSSVSLVFKKYGELLNVKVLRDLKQRPFSFVQFKTHQDADRAYAEAAGTILHGRKIRIEKAKVNRTIYVSKIKDLSEQQIHSVFEQFGEIEGDLGLF
ncbi:hypothetical protein HDV01_000468 [Terramyces sp. JEL0728]|nr:hypothetical protein HDV01_000468 [Terramyces sp. JEL0728]